MKLILFSPLQLEELSSSMYPFIVSPIMLMDQLDDIVVFC